MNAVLSLKPFLIDFFEPTAIDRYFQNVLL